MLQKFDVSRLSIISKLILDFNAMLFLHLIMTLCNKPVHYRVFGTRILLMKKQELWKESLQNSEMRWLLWPLKISPRWILANLHYNWNFLCSYKKKAHTFKNVIFMYFLFFLLCCGDVSQAPIRPEDSVQLGLRTGYLPHEFGGRVSRNGIRTFHFPNTHSGTDVFYRDCKMRFRNKGVCVMFWYNIVRDHCIKRIPADNHNFSLWKLVYNICV